MSRVLQVTFFVALLASTSPAIAADSVVNSFGSWRIERVEKNNSYDLIGVPTQGTHTYFTVKCFPGQNALTLILPFPPSFSSNDKEVTIVVWSDKPETVTTRWLVLHSVAAINILAPDLAANPYEDEGETFLRILREAPTAFSYSIGTFSMTHDTFHLHAALQRFSELCGPTPVRLIPSPQCSIPHQIG
jgi:hypothetical protein